jgi:hypothetical protein
LANGASFPGDRDAWLFEVLISALEREADRLEEIETGHQQSSQGGYGVRATKPARKPKPATQPAAEKIPLADRSLGVDANASMGKPRTAKT